MSTFEALIMFLFGLMLMCFGAGLGWIAFGTHAPWPASVVLVIAGVTFVVMGLGCWHEAWEDWL